MPPRRPPALKPVDVPIRAAPHRPSLACVAACRMEGGRERAAPAFPMKRSLIVRDRFERPVANGHGRLKRTFVQCTANDRIVRVAAVHLVLMVRLRRMADLVKLQCSINLVSERQQWAGSDMRLSWIRCSIDFQNRVVAAPDLQIYRRSG